MSAPITSIAIDQGGLNPSQEREVSDQLEREFGLNPKYGFIRNSPQFKSVAEQIIPMTEEDWDEKFRSLPYYGDWEASDINNVQKHLLRKYPIAQVLGILDKFPLISKGMREQFNMDDIKNIQSNSAYRSIMEISPDAVTDDQRFSYWKSKLKPEVDFKLQIGN